MAFCDWLTIYQQHDPETVQNLNAGRVVRLVNETNDYERKFSIVDDHGEVWTSGSVEYTCAHAIQHKGSFDTSIYIKAEAGRVTLSGNVGAFNRSDNVFGYGVADCVAIANRIVTGMGLPPFSSKIGKSGWYARIDKAMKLGAVITRVDLTKNYSVGNREQAAKLMHYIGGLNRINKPSKSYGEAGVTWAEGSEYWYAKLYAKYLELIKNKKNARPELVEFVTEHGLLRDEISLKSKYLERHNLRSIEAWSEGNDMENVIYGRFNNIFKATEISTDPFESLPGRLGELAVMWRNGTDLQARLPRNTFYRYRKKLLEYGIDIKQRCDVSRLPFRVQVIEMNEIKAPYWYELPAAA